MTKMREDREKKPSIEGQREREERAALVVGLEPETLQRIQKYGRSGPHGKGLASSDALCQARS